MLNSVGFDAEVEFLNSTTDIIRVINVEKNYDLGQSALSVRDSAPFLKLYSVFHSDSTGNASGYANPEMDELLATLQRASTQEEIQSAIDEIESLAAETVPTLPLAAQDNLVVWQPEVQGASHSFADIMLLDEVWLS